MAIHLTQLRLLLIVLMTSVATVAATLLAIEIFADEAAVEGALKATMTSSVLGEDREYLVHLPEGYASDAAQRFPVLYVLDGGSQSGHTAHAAALLARVGLVPPMIVVGVPSLDGDTRNRDYTPPDMRLDTDVADGPNGVGDRFLSHLETEFIPLIERQYRTRRPRMLAGWSRGGLFVVYSRIAAPALFDAGFAHSPALWREDGSIVGQLERAVTTSTSRPTFLFLSLGALENEKMTAAFHDAQAMLQRSAPADFRWRTYLSRGGEHDTNPRIATPVGLCAMFNPERACRLATAEEATASQH